MNSNNFYSPNRLKENVIPKGNARGTILSVDPIRRTYNVHINSNDPRINDAIYTEVQVLSASSSSAGEESGALAEINTLCCVSFFDQKPFIIGFYNPKRLTPSKDPSKEKNIDEGIGNDGAIEGSASGSKGTIDIGDYIVATRGGNKIVVRRSGIVEIESKKTCRTNYFPQEDKIFHMCRKFEFHSDAVTEFHTSAPSTSSSPTYAYKKFINQIEGDAAIVQERGKIPTLSKEIIERITYGMTNKLDNKNKFISPSYAKETYSNGKIIEAIQCGTPSPTETESAWFQERKEDGEFIISCGKKVWRLNVKSDGNTSLKINKKFSLEIEPSGNLFLNINDKYKFKIEPSGNFSINSNDKLKINGEASGIFDFNSNDKFKLNIQPSGDFSINSNEKIKIKGESSGNFDFNSNDKLNINVNNSGEFNLSSNEKFKLKFEPSGNFSINSNEKLKINGEASGSFNLNSNDKIKLNSESSGNLSIEYAESLSIKGDKGEKINLKNSQVSIGNNSVDIVDILCETLQTLSTTTAKGFGAPLDTVGQFATLLTKIKPLKM